MADGKSAITHVRTSAPDLVVLDLTLPDVDGLDLCPVLRQSGKSRRLQRPGYANNKLKRVFYQSAFCSLADPLSRAFYERKRREGKRHHQAVIALVRRRIDILWALIATRTPFSAIRRKAA